MTPHAKTIESIELQEADVITQYVTIYDCGCERWHDQIIKPRGWHLCAYHDGYNDALEAVS